MAFNDYEVLGSIGAPRQGKALAWRELPIGVRGHYALQWIDGWRAGDPDYQLRLLSDATLGQQIEHPTLVRVHEVLLEEDRAVVVTDYVDGVSLEEVLVRREAASDPVPSAVALELAARLLDAVAHLHALQRPDGGPCFHGRITPAQVMLTVDGGAKLGGFGVASGVPERRSSERLGPAVDQYAIGVILLDLLLGRRMAVDESMQPTAGRWPPKLEEALRDVELSAPAFPVVLRLLAPDPVDRYPTAADAAAQVQRVRSRLPGAQRLPAFASAEVERVRNDVADETDLDPAGTRVPWGSQPEVELLDEPDSEWIDGPVLDEEMALTVPGGPGMEATETVPDGEAYVPRAGGPDMEAAGTVPNGEAFVPRAGRWWAVDVSEDPRGNLDVSWHDCEDELSCTEPVGQVDPSLLGPAPATDTTATLPFAEAYRPQRVRTRTVPGWGLGAQTQPIPWGSCDRMPAVPVADDRTLPWTGDGPVLSRDDLEVPWGSCADRPVARPHDPGDDIPWGSCANMRAVRPDDVRLAAAQETVPWGSPPEPRTSRPAPRPAPHGRSGGVRDGPGVLGSGLVEADAAEPLGLRRRPAPTAHVRDDRPDPGPVLGLRRDPRPGRRRHPAPGPAASDARAAVPAGGPGQGASPPTPQGPPPIPARHDPPAGPPPGRQPRHQRLRPPVERRLPAPEERGGPLVPGDRRVHAADRAGGGLQAAVGRAALRRGGRRARGRVRGPRGAVIRSGPCAGSRSSSPCC